MSQNKLEVNASGTGYVEVRSETPTPEPEPIDANASVHEKLDRIISLLGQFITVVPDAETSDDPSGVKPSKILHVHGSGPVSSTTVPEVDTEDSVHDQQFGFGKDGPHQTVEADVNRSELTVSADGKRYESRNQRIAKLYAKGE